MNFSLSLRTQLSILFAITTTLLILIFGIVFGYRSINQVESEIGNSLSEAANSMANNLDQYMWSRYGETTILSNLSDIRQGKDEEAIGISLDQLQSTFPAFSWIGMTDKKGTVIASTDSILKGIDISARPVYFNALETPFVGDVHEAVLLADLLPNPSGEPMKFVDISTPVYDDNNEFAGVLATHLSWNWIKEIEASMQDSIKTRENVDFIIVSKLDNTVILGPEEMMGHKLELKSIDKARTNQNGWLVETWPDNKKYVTGYIVENGYKEYPGLEWTVLVRQPVEVAYAPVKKLLAFFIVFGIIFILIFAVLGWFLAGRVASPLKNLASTADRLRSGEVVQIPSYKGILELETLSDSLRKLILNLTKTESALEEMEGVAARDGLTGLANRFALNLYLQEFNRKYRMATVLYLDLDGFKLINDTLGHSIGDELLFQVGDRLKRVLREEEMIFRIGGDEFVVILPSLTGEKTKRGKLIGERIISAINKPYWLDGQDVNISCSIGGAFWESTSSKNMEETIKLADEALYIAKKAGKNRFHLN